MREFFQRHTEQLQLSSRDFERWALPDEFNGGMRIPFRVYVANEALKKNPELPTKKTIRWFTPRPKLAIGFFCIIASPQLVGTPIVHEDLELIERFTLPDYPGEVWFYAHHHDAARVGECANNSIIQFASLYGDVPIEPGTRIYAQMDKPEEHTGSRNFIEIPTYSLSV